MQVQRWLGHHSPSFTLDTYVHLLDADLGTPLQPLSHRSAEPKVETEDAVEIVSDSVLSDLG